MTITKNKQTIKQTKKQNKKCTSKQTNKKRNKNILKKTILDNDDQIKKVYIQMLNTRQYYRCYFRVLSV